ncbi:MAG: phasin family protein [Burkholderiaceae bacterium]|nr:phasin family protein [Burkholderiaceae bacterium]
MFTQNITPAVKDHMDVQLSFFTDLSKKMFDTAQKVSEINLQLAQELVADMTACNQQLMSAKDPAEFASVASTQIQPCTEKLRNYQQRLSNLIANANAELTRTAETHMPEASRTAAAVTDELVRTATEETEKATQRQRAVIDKMNESARRGIDGLSQSMSRGADQNPGQDQPYGQPH